MIISHIMGGIGNQLFQYATGRRLAHKLNTELKLDITFYEHDNFHPYTLNFFNIKEALATYEEIQRVKQYSLQNGIGKEKNIWSSTTFMPEVLDYPDNVWLYGYWQYEEYFADIRDILCREFTLRQPLSATARKWKEKILAAECSVSLHFRHGDYIYNPKYSSKPNNYVTLPLEYYYLCLKNLRQQYKNLTAFIFSDNLKWCKENFRSDIPTEFVSGEGLTDFEELYLMSLCKHNIRTKSTFSWWGAWLNQNPDKKVFTPIPASDAAKSTITDENSPLDSDRWIEVPFDLNKQPEITQKPYFSLLLVVNDNAATLNETLGSLLGQDYKYYEIVIIDNASTDGSRKICRQVANAHDNVTLISLYDKISDGAAWNKALDLAQGYFVLFLSGDDRIFPDTLTSLYVVNQHTFADLVNSVVWLKESDNGNIEVAGKKFVMKTDAPFQDLNSDLKAKFDMPMRLKILAANEAATPLGTKMFKRKFLVEKGIRFNEQIGDKVQRFFNVDSILQADEMIFSPTLFYIMPKKY